MGNESKADRWIRIAEKEKGHSLVRHNYKGRGRRDYELNIFAYNPRDPHNGPRCIICGEGWCWHCMDASEIPDCKGIRREDNMNAHCGEA